jgi:circadian clock protein KaiC
VRRAISVIKKRTSAHEDTIREYRIGGKDGFCLGEPLNNFQGVLRGVPELLDPGRSPDLVEAR